MPAMHRHWTSEQVRQLIDASRAWPRYELIDGELLVTPSPGPPHQLAVGELYLLVAPYVEQERVGLTLFSPSDIELRPDTITQPDLYVLLLDQTRETQLRLAVEVISPSSARTDRVTKRDFYLDSGVAEYWVVDLEARIVERWEPHQETPILESESLRWLPVDASRPLIIELKVYFERIRQKAAAASESTRRLAALGGSELQLRRVPRRRTEATD